MLAQFLAGITPGWAGLTPGWPDCSYWPDLLGWAEPWFSLNLGWPNLLGRAGLGWSTTAGLGWSTAAPLPWCHSSATMMCSVRGAFASEQPSSTSASRFVDVSITQTVEDYLAAPHRASRGGGQLVRLTPPRCFIWKKLGTLILDCPTEAGPYSWLA